MHEAATRDESLLTAAIAEAIAGRVGRDRYELWLGEHAELRCVAAPVAAPVESTRSPSLVLQVVAREPFRLEYLKRQFRAEIAAAATEILGAGASIEFVLAVVDDTADPSVPSAPAASPAKGPAPEPLATRTEEPAARQSASSESNRPARRPFASLTEFVASRGSELALASARSVVAHPGQYSPLTFVGPPGCGKTHLLEGIWRETRSRGMKRVTYLTAEQFTNQFLDALKQSGTPNFRRKVRDVDLLLIDDLQFFAGKQSTIVELVHTIDTLLREGRQLVFAADRPPAELRGLGVDLPTRLAGGLVCPLEPADAPARRKIVEQLARKQQTELPGDVLDYIAAQLGGDARHLAGAVNRLAATAMALARKIDLHLAEVALADLVGAAQRPIRLPEILAAVCDVFGVDAQELQSSSKAPSVTLPRMLVMFLARKYTRAALSEIGRSVGRKSHSTVVSAEQKVSAWLTAGKQVPLGRGNCALEDAVRRVELKMRLA
jgi:chromosomal replication initiator protein